VIFGITSVEGRARRAVDPDHITDLAASATGSLLSATAVGAFARALSCTVAPGPGMVAIVDHIERGGWQADAWLSVPGGVRGCDSRREDVMCLRAAVRPRHKFIAPLALLLGRCSDDRVLRPDDHRAGE
jgi:hypothetical protein